MEQVCSEPIRTRLAYLCFRRGEDASATQYGVGAAFVSEACASFGVQASLAAPDTKHKTLECLSMTA
jgi:hypothetical protein